MVFNKATSRFKDSSTSRLRLMVQGHNAHTSSQHNDEQFLVVESCHSTWLFDQQIKRFCRVMKSMHDTSPIRTDWREYHALNLDDRAASFSVEIADGRVLRAWKHTIACVRCGRHVAGEVSLDDLRVVTGA